jgi:type II secretory pathway pseudopilin PulG
MPGLKGWLASTLRDSRRAQAGTTLVELLVSLTIAALALSLVVGTISTGLLDATLAKRNTAAQAVVEYEMEQVSASGYITSPSAYSDCFATEQPTNPAPATGYQGSCSIGYTLRADVSWQQYSRSVQKWTIVIIGWPSGASTGTSIQLLKAPR